VAITSGGKVGTATIDGVRCNHLFFEQAADDLDLRLRVPAMKIGQGKRKNWRLSTSVVASHFFCCFWASGVFPTAEPATSC